jgi:arsenite methyltransferase
MTDASFSASPAASTDVPNIAPDEWSEWLLHHRQADDPIYGKAVRNAVEGYAKRVLDAAQLAPGMTLADIGTGEGLIAFHALERIGSSLRVILTDVSAPMLHHAETVATQRGVREQCTFLECPADNLHEIADSSVDVVTTRAVLAYVADKRAALREFYRILKPGGRISLAEPIFQDEAYFVQALRQAVEAQGPEPTDLFLPLLHRWRAAQFPDTEEQRLQSPIVNYAERDLLNFVRDTGFGEIHLQLHIDVTPSAVPSWDVFLGISPHPWAPPLRHILAEQFTPEEQQFFEAVVRPTIESGDHITTDRIVYLNAQKPLR